jgi:hypothetical protein
MEYLPNEVLINIAVALGSASMVAVVGCFWKAATGVVFGFLKRSWALGVKIAKIQVGRKISMMLEAPKHYGWTT